MPTLSGRFPSFQLGLLKPFLERQGFAAQPFSLFMYLGTHLGWHMNEVLAEVWPSLIGEWIWTRAAFGEHEEDPEYFEVFERNFRTISKLAGCSIADLRRIRDDAAPRFIDFCIDSVDWSRFGLVGFSLVFQQLLASIALARALKQRHPSLPIMFGGAALEDDIAEEVIRGCPQVDYVFCGDAEISLPKILRAILEEKPVTGLQGLMSRDGGQVVFGGRAANLQDLNVTPVPEFEEYFYARTESGYSSYSPHGAGLLVGSETPLHVLRPQPRRHGISRQGAATGDGHAGDAVAPLWTSQLQRDRQYHGSRIHGATVRASRRDQKRYPPALRNSAPFQAGPARQDAQRWTGFSP